jgi:hypothetical protein
MGALQPITDPWNDMEPATANEILSRARATKLWW